MDKLSRRARFVGCDEKMMIAGFFVRCNEGYENCKKQFFWKLGLGRDSGKDGGKGDFVRHVMLLSVQKRRAHDPDEV